LLAQHGVDGASFTTTVIDAAKSGKSLRDVIAAAVEIVGGFKST
jgi:hypothetical protein